MARMTNKKRAETNKQLWDKANSSHRQRWQVLSQKGYDFYLNEQLTKEETDSLNEAGMPTFTINRVTPIIEIMKYFVTANNPRWKAVGATGDDVDAAQVHSDIADYCWYYSNGKSIYSQVVLDSLTKGIGYFMVDVDRDADRGMGEVQFKKIDPYDVYVDPASRDFLFRDANFISVRKNVSKTQLMNLFPEFANKMRKVSGNSGSINYSQRPSTDMQSIQPEDITMGITIEGEDDDIIPYYETYSKKKHAYRNVFIKVLPSPIEMQQIRENVDEQMAEFQQEVQVQLKEKSLSIQQSLEAGEIIPERAEIEIDRAAKMTEQAIEEKKVQLLSEAQDSATIIDQQIMTEESYQVIEKGGDMKDQIVEAIKFYENRVHLTCTVGDDVFLYDRVLPVSEYPIVPIPYMYTGTPYAMSAVSPLIGKQQEINKAHQIMLHNANLASNLRWMYEEGSVPEEEWEQYSSSPGALLKYRQGFAPPSPVMPAPINNAFYTITQEGKGDAEYIAGVPSAMMGFTQEQSETYRGLLANDEFGTRRLKAWMGSVVEPALEHLGRCFQMMAQNHYSVEKVFRIVQPEAGQQPDEEKDVRINIPIYNDYGKAISVYKDYASARFDIRIIAGATMPINRWALLEEYFRWFQSGLIDDIAMIGETDIRNKKQIIERKSMYSQLQGQVSSMEEAIKDKDGTIETLERQLVQAGIKMKVGDAANEVRKDVLETEAQQKLLRGMMKAEFDRMRKDMQEMVKSQPAQESEEVEAE
ncbi:MAG: hypothetical protein HN802_03070 [Candidatus Jacksonbacteria bacterium]|nr:hypothetical protein [Candidatus Jacksonbacteria bacterium]